MSTNLSVDPRFQASTYKKDNFRHDLRKAVCNAKCFIYLLNEDFAQLEASNRPEILEVIRRRLDSIESCLSTVEKMV